MNDDQIKAWVSDPRRADTYPFGVYEPAYRKGITGAALVVRGVVYFRNGCARTVRDALARCYEQYDATITEYHHALEVAAGQPPSSTGPLRWFYTEGHQPTALDKSPGVVSTISSTPPDQAMAVEVSSGEHKLGTGFYQFSTMTNADWQNEMGMGLDAIVFTVPRAFIDQRPGVFQALFTAFCEALPTVNGHAGFGVNLPAINRHPNEATEFYLARRLGPGLDVGFPMDVGVVDLVGMIKTVDWIVALDADLVRAAGGPSGWILPPDWFVRQPFGEGGMIIQAGAEPQTGISAGPGNPPAPPAAYVLLNLALRPIVAKKMGIIQGGTLDSTAPMLNTDVASEAWLRRFDVPEDKVGDYWRDLHQSATVTDGKAAVANNLHRLRKAMGLSEPVPSNGFGYDGGSPG